MPKTQYRSQGQGLDLRGQGHKIWPRGVDITGFSRKFSVCILPFLHLLQFTSLRPALFSPSFTLPFILLPTLPTLH